jgi:hypothetical protein
LNRGAIPPLSREQLKLRGAVLAFVALVASLAAAYVTSNACGGKFAGDLTPFEKQSGYCGATHFPGFPDSIGSLLLTAVVYLAPFVVAVAGTALSLKRESRRVFDMSTGITAILLANAWVLSAVLASSKLRSGP